MTTYRVIFRPRAKKAWEKPGHDIRVRFARKLDQRRRDPRVLSAALSRMKDCYKIRLRASGYRLVYRVYDDRIEILVLSVGKRERGEVYKNAARELQALDD